MANHTLLASITEHLVSTSWEAICVDRLNNSSYDWTHDLVNSSGKNIPGLTDDTWGITVGLCNQYCGSIPFNFNFQRFAGAFTNYFLPWIALTAQLVFETGDMWNNFMSFCLAVGSPALITYSLTITILNRYWVHSEFSDFAVLSLAEGRHTGDTEFSGRIRVVRLLLQEAQQVPLRASQKNRWLTSLLALPQNSRWWGLLEDRLKTGRRGFTASLVAQMFVAAIAFLFTVISSFAASLGDISTGNQIGSGSLWIWLIPVILGWVTVGTQYRHNSIERALTAVWAHRVSNPNLDVTDFLAEAVTVEETQEGLIVESAFTLESHGRLKDRPFTWAGAKIEGDERLKGPIFNYARVFVWWQLSSTILSEMVSTLDAMKKLRDNATIQHEGGDSTERSSFMMESVSPVERDSQVISTEQSPNMVESAHPVEQDIERFPMEQSPFIVRSARPVDQAIEVFPRWSKIPASAFRRIVAAAFAAIFLQWGTAGASLLIGYTTPTIGLGCRSGSYLVYGVLGTLTWMFLLASSFLSHDAMLRHQLAKSHSLVDGQSEQPGPHSALCAAAVITRYIGKSLAIINTVWLIASSLFEIVGAYDNCWCKSCEVSLGSHAWVTIFKTAGDLDLAARLPWGAGLAMMLIVVISYMLFAVGSMGREDD